MNYSRDSQNTEVTVINDLGRTEVANKNEPTVWPGFRIFTAVKDSPEEVTSTRNKRRLNTFANPFFDFTNDTLFDYPTIIADRFSSTDWGLYNRLCSVHTAACPFDCWHCYNDAKVDPERGVTSDKLTAEFIFEKFREQRKYDRVRSKQTNVLRITGGEPFTQPTLILKLAELMTEYNKSLTGGADDPKCAIWTETNLVPLAMGRSTEIDGFLSGLAEYKDCLFVHPCLHGLTDDDIEIITGNKKVRYTQLRQALKSLYDVQIDIYPTIHSNVLKPEYLLSFFEDMLEIDENLPLRFAIVEIELSYTAVKAQMSNLRHKRVVPYLGSRHATLFEWDRLLRNTYGIGYGVMPRHLVHLHADGLRKGTATNKHHTDPDVSKRCVLLFKSSERGVYRQEALTILGLPKDFIYTTEYASKWVAQDIVGASSHWPDILSESQAIPLSNFYVEQVGDQPVVTPIRTGTLLAVSSPGHTVAFHYSADSYPSVVRPALQEPETNLAPKLWSVFGSKTLPPGGTLFAVMSPAFETLKGLPDTEKETVTAWEAIVGKLAELPKMRGAAFCRLTIAKGPQLQQEGSGLQKRSLIKAQAKTTISLKIQYEIPNFVEIEAKETESPKLKVDTTNHSLLACIGPQEVLLSKYGEIELTFQCGVPDTTSEVEIHIWRSDSETLGPYFKIPVRVSSTKPIVGGGLTSIGAGMAALCAAAAGTMLPKLFASGGEPKAEVAGPLLGLVRVTLKPEVTNRLVLGLCLVGVGVGIILGFLGKWLYTAPEHG